MSVAVLRGDAAHLPLPDESVDLVVTSVPYWGLRSYTDGGKHYEGQIGSEETPQEWLEALWRCTAEWMRVLKPTGSIFVNCGDKYAAGHGGRSTESEGDNIRARRTRPATEHWTGSESHPSKSTSVIAPGFRPKTLMLLPQRYAIGCMDRLSLIARETIVWHKPNPIPESARDRCGRAHEDVFHFVRQPRYFAALDEIREPHTGNTHARRADGRMSPKELAAVAAGHRRGFLPEDQENPLGKAPGSVWTIQSQPLAVPADLGTDHFAAFPMELPRRIILGWSPSGICLECGEGRRPQVLREIGPDHQGRIGTLHGGDRARIGHATERKMLDGLSLRTITGYACACPDPSAPTRPSVVLDPFGGTGTVSVVADVLGRIGITVDRSMDYARLAKWRTSDPGERARALGVPKPPKQVDGQGDLFSIGEATA